MSINNISNHVFNSTVSRIDHFPSIATPGERVIEKVRTVSKAVFSEARKLPSEHPKVFFASLSISAALLLGGAVYALYRSRKHNQPLPQPKLFFSEKEIAITQAYIKDKKFSEAEKYVEKIVDTFLSSNEIVKQLGEESRESFSAHLAKRIYDVASIPGASKSSQIKMVENILSNFSSFLGQIKRRAETDSRKGKLAYLGVEGNARLTEMVALGKETHCKGKIPFKLIFSNDEERVELVYKPRSMLAELLVCDEQRGLLKNFGFGTYKVLDYEEEGEGSDRFYGYCDLLKNEREDNTLDSREELHDYFTKLCMLDKIAEHLGISDLHYQNILVSNKSPYLIDLEVFLIPNFETATSCIFSKEDGAAYYFDASDGEEPSLQGLNRLWFTANYQEEVFKGQSRGQLNYRITEEHLRLAGINVDTLAETIDMPEACVGEDYEERIEEIRQSLEQGRGRFVLMKTSELLGAYRVIDPSQEEAVEIFLDDIKKEVEKLHFTFHSDNVDQIKAQIREDFFNRDIPVFYYDSQTSCLYYQDVIIGRPSDS
ncbi:DUF4135 domain-containing protein [Parachlamydia sp. AcF125]|uniref:DUF4135 domain-containing protein n=1 Tax=Parachlamydia sp. AcF125 TaxID=2795736 RepID=UPI001BC97E46|nr:DUF4135 domain-containing protein [Parachlamydia sp. AcF125]MBS4167620.1 hypothetical protein [Parachlamydia sp. AcF125]